MQYHSPQSSRAWRPLLWSAALLFAITSFFTTDTQAQSICNLLNVEARSIGQCCFNFIIENGTQDTTIKRVAIDVFDGGSITSAYGPSNAQVTRTSTRAQWSFARGLPVRSDSLRACFTPARGSSYVYATINWYRGDAVICSDTLVLRCGTDTLPHACAALVEQENVCAPGENGAMLWRWVFNVENQSSTYGRSYRIEPMTQGVTVTPNDVNVQSPVAPNGLFPRQTVTISGGQPGQVVGFRVIMCGSSTPDSRDLICCTTFVEVRLSECDSSWTCLTITNSEIFCDSTRRDGFIWCFTFQNNTGFPVSTLTFGSTTTPISPAVQPGQTRRICLPLIGQPGGTVSMTLRSCSSAGVIRDTVNGTVVIDSTEQRCCNMPVTLRLPECDPPSDGCFEFVNQEIVCDTNGTYRWCFNVRNNANWTMRGIELEARSENHVFAQISPHSITFPNGVRPGALSQRVCVTIHGAKPGRMIAVAYNYAMEIDITCNDTFMIELPECEPTHRECCDGFLIGIANDRPVAAPNGLTGVIGLIAAGPSPISKVSATIVSSSINGQPAYGYAVNGLLLNGFGAGTVTPAGFGQEIIWSSPTGVPMMAPSFSLNWLRFPPMAPNAKADTLSFCIRWRFTDVECRTCDTLVCYRVVRRRLLQFNNIGTERDEKGSSVQGGEEFVSGKLSGDNSGSVRIVLPDLSGEFGTVTYTGLSLQATDGATITGASEANSSRTYQVRDGLLSGEINAGAGTALDLSLDYVGLDGRSSLGHLLILTGESSLMPGQPLEIPISFTLRSEGAAGGDVVEAVTAEIPGKTVVTYALHVRNQNGTQESLSGLRLHATEGMSFLAVGPTSGETDATLRFGYSGINNRGYISEAAEGTVALEPGMERRPIYLTVALNAEAAPVITFETLNEFDEVISSGEIDLLDISSVTAGGTTGDAAAILSPVHPNPTTGIASLVVSLQRAEESVQLVVRDAAGREVLRVVDGEAMAAGSHLVTTDLSSLASGVYFVTLETAAGVVTQRTTVAK